MPKQRHLKGWLSKAEKFLRLSAKRSESWAKKHLKRFVKPLNRLKKAGFHEDNIYKLR